MGRNGTRNDLRENVATKKAGKMIWLSLSKVAVGFAVRSAA
jgi:hypothetical protein